MVMEGLCDVYPVSTCWCCPGSVEGLVVRLDSDSTIAIETPFSYIAIFLMSFRCRAVPLIFRDGSVVAIL
jgi:hypothetical protein